MLTSFVCSTKLHSRLLCQRLRVEIGKFDPFPYLWEMGSNISITYLANILAIIATRKVVEKAKATNADVFNVSKSATLRPVAQISPLSMSKDQTRAEKELVELS